MEGERLTSALFDRYARDASARETAQASFVQGFGWISPVIALRQLSMALAGTDALHHQDFLDQAERYRYSFVQTLNQMQVDQIPNRNAGEDPRISAANWRSVPSFTYHPPDTMAAADARVWPNLLLLGAWLAVLALLVFPVGRRLGRISR
jgi:ABC-2 type transport system permease protein